MQISPHRDVDACFIKTWTSLNSYKQDLFGFETLVFATLGILYLHKQLVTLQREKNMTHEPFKYLKIRAVQKAKTY